MLLLQGLCCLQWTRFDREQSAVCQRSCLRIRGGNDGGDKKLRDQFTNAVMQGSSNKQERKNEEIGDVQQEIKVVQGKIEGVQQEIKGVQQEIKGVQQEIKGVQQQITDVLTRMHDQNDPTLKEVHMQLVAYQQQLVEDKKQLVAYQQQLVEDKKQLLDREKLLLDKDKQVEGLIPRPVQLRDSMSRPEGETELNVAIMSTNRTDASWHAKFLGRALDYRMRRKGFMG